MLKVLLLQITYSNFIFISLLQSSNLILLYFIPHLSNNLLDAMLFSELAYLSDKYITSFIPDCIIILAHSLHGNKSTYIFEFSKSFLLPL